MAQIMSVEELDSYVKDNGQVEVKLLSQFKQIPQNTVLTFEKDEDYNELSTFEINNFRGYNFDVEWSDSWYDYDGNFLVYTNKECDTKESLKEQIKVLQRELSEIYKKENTFGETITWEQAGKKIIELNMSDELVGKFQVSGESVYFNFEIPPEEFEQSQGFTIHNKLSGRYSHKNRHLVATLKNSVK
jgi:hypothetical protein